MNYGKEKGKTGWRTGKNSNLEGKLAFTNTSWAMLTPRFTYQFYMFALFETLVQLS